MNSDRWLTRSFVFLCSLTLIACLTAAAQTTQTPARNGRADIPFEFYVGGNKLPAGAYTFDLIAPTYVMMRSQDGKLQQDLYFLQESAATKNMPSKIVFVVRDGKYYFSEVWSLYGKSQLTTFSSKAGDQTKDVALQYVEKNVAKP